MEKLKVRGRIKKHSWREASLGALVVKNPSASVGGCKRCRFDPWVGMIPWRGKWHPTPVFLPGKFHGQRNLVGYSPWGHKDLDMTELLTLLLFNAYENKERL